MNKKIQQSNYSRSSRKDWWMIWCLRVYHRSRKSLRRNTKSMSMTRSLANTSFRRTTGCWRRMESLSKISST